ncbi:DEAD/DEAH box helicase family protein [Megasphaera sp. CLA-AA-H81]|uniref:DEAD/DEAH box helicase family protein n=1 Tax=Megasphaera intestinihominis TaxID=3133159 RepID=A0ABV1CWI3_9FIRM
MALNYLDKAAWDAGVYKDKGNDDDTQQDTSSEDSGYSASGILSAAKNFLEHPFQGMGTVIAPNYTPRPLDDSVYSDIPGTPVASGQFGKLEDESVRDERMKDSADYMAANWPRLYGGVVAADEGLANVVGGIQNAVGGGNGILTNVQRAEEGMQNYRDQWNNEYGDSYFLNPNKFATDVGSGIGSTVPIMALSALMPGAAVAGGTRALTSALSRAGLGRLAMSEAGQALIADTVRSPISSLADSLSEYGTVVNDMMQNGMSEDEARRRAIPMFFKNMALDTFTVPLELGVMKGGKGIATGLLGRSAEEGMAKSIAKGAARTGMLAGASGLTEGYQEGAQNALENDVQGKRDGGWYNPLTWTNEDWESARGGFVGGALMGVPGNVAAGFHPETRQAPLSAESQEQAQSIKDTLSHGKPAGMSNAAYNAYIELANSGNPDLIKQAASSLESFPQSQESSQESTDDAATEAYKDYEAYDQKQKIENFLDNNTVEQIGGEKNFNWLMGVLRNGTPEEVQHAYDTVIAAEKATAEQEAKNRPASGGGSMSPNTGNAMANIVIQAANDSGVEPRLGLAIAARESGGDDVNAISMPEPHDGVYGVMQAQEETVSNMGLDSQYPDWKTDPYQNAMVGMAILKAKIDGENGDVWAGVRDYDGAGEEAEQYRQLVKNNYDNMGDIGGGGSGNVEAPSEAFYDLSEAMNPQVDGMDPNTMAKMNLLAHDFYQKYGHRLLVTSLKRNGDGSSYHDEGHAFDFSDDFLEQNPDARDWLVQQGEKYGLKGLDEFSHPVATTDGGNVHFTDHGGPAPGGASSGVSGKVTSDNGQFERELDQAAQEAKSDMDKIQAQSDQAMNEIMNDDSTEKTAQDAQQDAEDAQKQAEEGQQSVQDDVVPDVAQTIRDTSSNIDEINALDGMFTKDSNGNDKFIDTPENRDFIKTNYKDEIAKAVNDAMNKKKAPSATPVPKSQQQTPHARLGRILSTYDRKDPKFKEYMNTFRNGTEQEQQKLADDLQTTQELERANSLKGNPLTTQQDQNIPQNVPQQAVEATKQPEQVNTPVQTKESLETQKKRNAYLTKKQKLMERVPAGRTVKVHASTNDAGFDATYKIVPAGDITASHDMNYAVNDLYPAEYQPRDRNRPQMRGQVEKMTKGMKPELLAESQFVNEGAPVINNSGVVLNGNGRVMAVQKAYKGLTDAHKKSAKAYKDYLVSIAPSLGIAPEKVQSMDHPVLVRQAADNADTNAIINSTEGGAKLGGAEQAKADADRLKLSTLEQFVDNGTGEFMNPSNREFRRAAASDVFSDAEGNSVFNEKGDLSPTGAFRIRNAIFAKAYNDNYLLTQLSEATDNNSKNIMNAMIAAAPEVAKVNEGIKNGTLYPDYDISDVITKTAKTIMSLRNEGKPLPFHLQETDLFSQGGLEAERLVLEFIERNKFKSRTIADMYKGACDRIFAIGSPKQSKLFDSKEAPRISLENIISNAIQEVEHGQSLFDTTEEKPAEKAVSEVSDNRQAEPAGSGRVHQQEAGRVQSQEKEGNEVDEKSKQSDYVDTEPQQTESKDTEGTHAEEGSQGDVQEEISKFHNVLDDEKSTPKQVIDAYKSVVDKVIASADGSRKNAKMGDKIVTDEYQSLTNSKHWNAFMNEDGGRNWHEVATINADAHRALHAIINTAGVKAKEAPSSQGILPYKQAVDDIMDRLDHKKLTPARAINKLKIIMKDANAARWGEFKAMEAIESKEKLSFDDYKMALDLANDAMKKANDMRLEASRNRKARKTAKELESATKETQNDADIRFGTVDDAEKAVMEAFGVKPHKKPADTPAIPRKASTKDTPKKAAQKAVIKDDTKIEKTFHLLDDSDEALEAEKKAILEELSHLSVNPAFNPVLMYHLLKVGAIHVQRGLNEFAHWAKAMKDTLPQSEPFLRSVWDSLQSMPNNANLDEKQLTAAIRYVGSLYDHGMTDKVDLRKSFIATLGVKNAKYFDAVYNAVMEYPSIEELKGANVNVNRNVSELAARSGEGTSENAVGESRVQGRTAVRGSRQDTAPAGKGPEEPGMGHDSVPGSSTATGRTAGNRRVQTQESKDSAGSTGSAELPGSVRAGLERVPDDDQRRPAELVRAAQNRPQHEDPVEKVQEEQKDKHLNEIKKALPMLLPQQAEDVYIAENRFKEHSGMMFTNGTGTGKTYTGLGIVKRFVDADKKNILIIAPSDGILKQWEEAAAKDFGITLTRLNSTKDAGEGAVTATYANVGANQALVNRDFDLVITDESHNLMGSESATPTDALKLVRAVTGHKDGFQRYHHDKHPEISSKLDKLHEEIKKLRKRDSQNGKAYNETHDPSLADESRGIRNQIEKLEEEQSKWHKKLEAFKDADEKAFAEKQPSKALFLSATPFQYVADLDYANGYLFNYSDYGPMDEQGYNRANGREIFYMENFGYKMRYNRLERPSADVDTDLMEREFNRKMVESGAMHGRMLSSAYDYDRGFIRVDAGIGKKIDEGFDWLRDQPKYSELSDFLRGRFTGQQKYYLLEAIKAKQAIPLIKEYLKEGKKVVIFHNFNKGGADNPFAISRAGMDHLERLDSELADRILEQYHEFQAERPDLADLDLNDLESPIETLSKAFGEELALYNGTLSKGEREKNRNAFNNDDSKTKIILVQSAAGQAGVSLHDTTGKHQRALINLGLPTRPSEAIQQEGRIYRVGNKSNAIFRYLNTGTYMEQTAFATKLAERAGTVENIALGEMARSLKQAYVEAFEESQEGDGWKKYLPGSKTEGTGGKANDYQQEKATDFDRAKAVYFGKQKKNSRTKSQEGHDYFATPEPIGYKMVQWLQSKPGQSLLEPSAGDGAIARWMPDNTYNTVVEPSRDLTPKLMRNVAGAKVVESTFENFDLHNKFDGIAMNPPFGKGKDRGGKLAMEHVAKAYKHLKDGGRLIAIIPGGPACQKRFDKWFYGDPEAKRKEDRGIADGVLMADIHLPSVTFEREGTNVNTRMVVIDKYTDEGTRQIAEAEARGRIDIAADDVNELFDRIEGMDMPERLDMSDEKKQASIREAGQQLTRSKEDLKVEIKDAFPNAKGIKDEGDRMTFTMPNGSHIVVDVKNEILLTDEELAQAKKDHHIDDNGNVVVEGYAQLHGKDAYMALSQGSRENTGFHEAYHLAEGAVLADREKAAIKKAIPDAEKRADKYAEWVEARKHGRGTAWGKLFQKIKDFAAKMKKIFTGTETVNNIFRQIESGRVWEREVNEQNTNNINGEKYYSIRKQDEKISRDAKKKLMKHVEIAQKKADEKDIGVHRTFLQSPSRIAEKKKYFRPFFKMADDAMNLLTKLRADYQRHLDSALNLSKKDKASLQELLWAGDMEGKEYTREELREQGYNEQVIDSYWKIRNLFRKAYNQLNETRKQAKTKTGHFSGRKLDELRHNKFVEILRETEQDDGSTLVSYKEYGNWQSHYLVNEDELKALENDDNIQILEKIPTTEGPMDGQKHWKVTTREGVPDIHDRKGYVPHFFHEYMVRFVDSHGKATVISSGRTIREATKNAIKWQAENEEMLKKRNEGDWKITIAPKVFDFGEIGLDESQYVTTVGDKDFYRMEKRIADKHSLTLHEAKEMLDGMVRKKGRHRFFGNFLRRTGADGYEQEIEWVLRHYFNSTSRYVAMESKFKPQAISLFERLFGRFDNEYHGLPNYIKEYINDINGNPSTLEKQLNDLLNAIPAIGKWVNAHVGDRAAVSLANSITNKISIAKLGFLNVSSAMLNILQIANAAAYTGNISTLWKALLKGAHRKYSLHDLKILRETNVLNDIGLDSGAGYGKFSAGKWANRGMILFKESEGIVRRGVTLAAYEAGRKRGMSHEEAIRYAKDVNRKSNFDYGVHDAPGIFRRGSIFSQIFLQFKKYPIKQLEAMKDFLPFFGKGTTKKQKAIFWGTYFAMAGLFQIPFANILGLLIMGITGDDPEKEAEKSLIELAENYPSLKPLAKIGMYGIGTFANIDITSRVGIGDAVPDDLQSIFGPAASTLFNVAKSAYGGDNWTKQVRNISPGMGNLLMAAQGNSVGKRGRVTQEYTTPYQRLLRGMGFQSTDESDSYLIQSILSSEKKKASSKKQQLIDEYIANPTGENARKLKSAGIKPSTVKAEQKKKQLDTQGRTESSMNKNDKKQYKYLLDW